MANPEGRPTLYTPELLKKARKYIDGAWNHGEDVIPSHIGLAKFLGISRITLYEWASHEDKKLFSNMLDECMAAQQTELINKGLSSTFNSNITKLVLSKHGYADKQSTEVSGPGGGAIETKWTVEIIDVKEGS